MALIHFPGHFELPWLFSSKGTVAEDQSTLNAANEALYFTGQVYLEGGVDSASKTISSAGGKIWWVTGTSSHIFVNAGTTLRVGIQDTATTGTPAVGDGTFDVYDDLVGGTDTIAAGTGYGTAMTSGTKTIAHADLLTVAFEMTSLGGSDVVRIASFDYPQEDGAPIFPGTALVAPTATRVNSAPCALIEFDDGTLGWFYGSWYTSARGFTSYHLNTATYDEYGNLFVVPHQMVVAGVTMSSRVTSASQDQEIVLYEDPLSATPTILEAIVVDSSQNSGTNASGANVRVFTLKHTLDPAKTYAVTIRPTSATGNTAFFYTDVVEKQQFIHMGLGGGSCYAIRRSDNAGAFSDYNGGTPQTRQMGLSLLIGALDDGAGGGGGGGRIIGSLSGDGAMRDITLEDTTYYKFTTRAFATGIPTTLAGTPVLSVYEQDNLTQITAGVSITADYDSVTGLSQATIVATAANGYELGKSYDLVITTGTVDSVSVVGEVVHSFTIGSSAAAVIVADPIYGNSALNDRLGNLATGSSSLSVQAASYVLTTGTQSSGTITDTETLNGVYHEHTDTAGVLDLYYEFNAGGNGVGVDVSFSGRINGSNDTLLVYAWNWDDTLWDQVGELDGRNTSIDSSELYKLLIRNTGTGANIGLIRLRFAAASGLSSATFRVDKLSAAFSVVNQSVGYSLGRIWIDTNDGAAGAVAFVNGVADNAVLTWADALTLSSPSSVGITDFHSINGSSITLTANSDNYSIFGDNYSVALGGQSCVDIEVVGARVSGIGAAASGEMHFEGCDIGTVSAESGHYDFCGFSATVTSTLASDYNYHNCYSKVAGAGAPIFTKTAGQTITSEWRNWAGGITVSTIEAGDVMTIGGTLGTITLNGADGTVEIRGTYKAIVDNRTGSPVLNTDGAIKGVDVADILVDTNELQADWVDGGRLDNVLDSRMAEASINTTGGAVDVVTLVTTTTTNTDMLLATAIVSNGAITTLSGAVVNVYLVDTTTTNTDMLAAIAIVSNGAIATLSGAVVNVDLVDTTITNADMRGTDSAATASALATAQSDLDIITGTAGALLDPTATSAQLVDDVYDEAESGHNVGGSFGKGFRQVKEGTVSVESSVNDASATDTVFITALTEATDNHYIDVSIVFIDGVLAGQSRVILSYNGTTKAITLDEALTEAPANGDGFIIKTDHIHSVTQIQEGLATEAKQDIIDTNVDAVKAKTDSLTFTDAGKVDSTLQAAADVDATVANKIADHTRRRSNANAEASADGDALTFRSSLGADSKQTNKVSIAASTLTITKSDDTTALGTQTLTSNAAAAPITGADTV